MFGTYGIHVYVYALLNRACSNTVFSFLFFEAIYLFLGRRQHQITKKLNLQYITECLCYTSRLQLCMEPEYLDFRNMQFCIWAE